MLVQLLSIIVIFSQNINNITLNRTGNLVLVPNHLKSSSSNNINLIDMKHIKFFLHQVKWQSIDSGFLPQTQALSNL
uniref:Uncharacterized protein n=1 Tax=Arundo donax TaxID=35708 RepID=A0A0A9V310_ARUDO